MKTKHKILLILVIFCVCVAGDQATKAIAKQHLAGAPTIYALGGNCARGDPGSPWTYVWGAVFSSLASMICVIASTASSSNMTRGVAWLINSGFHSVTFPSY